MKIRITKKDKRNQMVCTRANGSTTISNLGPKLPNHDIAHFVIEQTLQLENGFYGNIANGLSVEQLSDKEIIKKLPAESWFAEIATRALQSTASGACTLDQFIPMVETEFKIVSINYKTNWNQELISKMLEDYKTLMEHWKSLIDGETLELTFITKSKLVNG